MLYFSNFKFSYSNVSDTVKLRISEVDKARSDPQNLIAVILKAQNDFCFLLGTREGKISQ